MNNKSSGNNDITVRLCVIGLGMMGKIHVDKASQINECEIVAICDIDPSTKGYSEKLGIKSYHNHIDMLDNERLDGVIISLSNDLHETMGIDCAQRGLDILMEKPIASSVKAAKKLIASVNKNNVRMLVAHQRRFNSKINAAREMIHAGDLGEMVAISILGCMYKPDKYFLDGPWRKKKISGGPVLINMIHEIDVLRYTYGEVERVYAEVNNKIRKFEVEDSVSVAIRFRDGTLATIIMSDTVPSLWGYDYNMGEIPIFYKTKGEAYTFMGTKASLAVPGMKKVYYPDASKVGWQHPLNIDKRGMHLTLVTTIYSIVLCKIVLASQVIGLLKKWLQGIHQGALQPYYLDYYLDEFTFRFNSRTYRFRRKLYRLLEQAVIAPPVTGQDIRGDQMIF